VSIEIFGSCLQGELTLPSSKSHTLRAFLFASMAKGKSFIKNPLISSDAWAMLKACEQFGASYQMQDSTCIIEGTAGVLKAPGNVIDCGNSGIAFRFLTALASLTPFYTVLTGDLSLRQQRPIEPLLSALRDGGVFAESARSDGKAPVIIKGPITSRALQVFGSDSQFVSALVILGAFVDKGLEIYVKSPAELPWIDLTCFWLDLMDIKYERDGYEYFKVHPKNNLQGFTYQVPGDLSSAAFSIVGALITNSEIKIYNIDLQDIQGDRCLIEILQSMGARFLIDAKARSLTVLSSSQLEGIDIDMDRCIDALPILAVLGCFAKGRTKLFNAYGAKFKESNRIFSIAKELKKMGAKIDEHEDGLTIYPSCLSSAKLNTYNDHRIVMALSTACLSLKKSAILTDISSVNKSYPEFFKDMAHLGLKYRLCH
jgi:3-phosphoshikimate 1-carboxyvinyltransferase